MTVRMKSNIRKGDIFIPVKYLKRDKNMANIICIYIKMSPLFPVVE